MPVTIAAERTIGRTPCGRQPGTCAAASGTACIGDRVATPEHDGWRDAGQPAMDGVGDRGRDHDRLRPMGTRGRTRAAMVGTARFRTRHAPRDQAGLRRPAGAGADHHPVVAGLRLRRRPAAAQPDPALAALAGRRRFGVARHRIDQPGDDARLAGRRRRGRIRRGRHLPWRDRPGARRRPAPAVRR